MFRREWRQQVLVLCLLTVTVAATIGFAAAAYNIAPQETDADFGDATAWFEMAEPTPAALASTLTAARDWFGTIDVVEHRAVAVPGTSDTVDYRGQDPDGAYGGPMLDLRDGRYPADATEVAVTDGVASEFRLELGGTFDLDGNPRTVVGIVESPSDLDDEFVLVAPGTETSVTTVQILVDADQDRLRSFNAPDYRDRSVSIRGDDPVAVLAVVSVLIISSVALILVALVAAASFVVVAQRRLQQLGVLGALGATDRHLRLVMLANGAVLGAVGAVLGAVVGLAGWIAVAPRLESALAHRIDPFNVPWWLIGAGVALAMAASTAAAAWPARAVARIPTVSALSGRPPRPVPVHRSAVLAAIVLAGGVTALATAGDVADERRVYWTNMLLVGAGTVATIVGVLLLCPLAIKTLARAGGRLPISWRLPLRDLARHQARSAASLAAITLVLGVPVAVVAITAGAEPGAAAGNLSDHQLVVRAEGPDGPFVPVAADAAANQANVERLASALGDVELTPTEVALDPDRPPPGGPGAAGRVAVALGEPAGDGWIDRSLLYVATPELLARYGVDLEGAEAEIFTTEPSRELVILAPRPARDDLERVDAPVRLDRSYTSLPGSFITLDALTARGWEAVPSGRWLVESAEPFTPEQLRLAREIAAESGLVVEARDGPGSRTALINGATAAGIALALGILVMTVGLIRAEASGDVRTLTATGATSIARRNLTAATAGGLAACGVVLGTIGAYLAVVAGFRELDALRPIPVAQLVVIVLGTPAAAAAVGWLVAGKEPAMVARRPID